MIDPFETDKPRALAFLAPPWEPEEVDTVGIVKRELLAVTLGPKIAKGLWVASGHFLLLLCHTLDERTLNQLRNLSELNGSATLLVVREIAR